jgi:hypothetical protein
VCPAVFYGLPFAERQFSCLAMRRMTDPMCRIKVALSNQERDCKRSGDLVECLELSCTNGRAYSTTAESDPEPTMPFHILHNRRRFLATSAAGLLALSARAGHSADKTVDADVVYLLNDTHVGEKHPSDSPVPSHLRQVVAEIVDRPSKPAAVIINGDLALHDGQPEYSGHVVRRQQESIDHRLDNGPAHTDQHSTDHPHDRSQSPVERRQTNDDVANLKHRTGRIGNLTEPSRLIGI